MVWFFIGSQDGEVDGKAALGWSSKGKSRPRGLAKARLYIPSAEKEVDVKVLATCGTEWKMRVKHYHLCASCYPLVPGWLCYVVAHEALLLMVVEDMSRDASADTHVNLRVVEERGQHLCLTTAGTASCKCLNIITTKARQTVRPTLS